MYDVKDAQCIFLFGFRTQVGFGSLIFLLAACGRVGSVFLDNLCVCQSKYAGCAYIPVNRESSLSNCCWLTKA